jgi:hypothetical protein
VARIRLGDAANALYVGIIIWELAAGVVLAASVVMWIVNRTAAGSTPVACRPSDC